MKVIVVGGGWAGLATAVELVRHGVAVTLLEANKQLGGRARTIQSGIHAYDNGQHLLLGAYSETLRLLQLIGVNENTVLERRPLELHMHTLGGSAVQVPASTLPAPLHLLTGLLRARGLSWHERYSALRFCLALARRRFELPADTCVEQLLKTHRQPERVIRGLWEPLCLAALNTPLSGASAKVFLRVLHDTFAFRRSDSDFLYTKVRLSSVFPEPARRYIESHGGRIMMGQRVKSLQLQVGAAIGVTLREQQLTADHIVLAVSPAACSQLLAPHHQLAPLAEQLGNLTHEPICTVYLHYPPAAGTGRPMTGIINGYSHWLFDHAHWGTPGLIAAVISGPGPHMELSNDALIAEITRELSQIFPQWPPLLHGLVVREKRATFSCKTNIHTHRPPCNTPISNLWLAGDYLATDYPATLEGAIRSGVKCAGEVLGK